ncbi:hypothetical protein HUU42_08125 [bacterium]|nr:hypothetical protein [bacterium]
MMNRVIIFPILLIIFYANPACKTSGTAVNYQSNEKYRITAQSKLGDHAEFLFNQDSSFVLCMKTLNAEKNAQVNSVSFFIFDLKEQIVVFEDALANVSVEWKSNEQVQVTKIPGTVKKDNQELKGYIFDVKSKKKIDIQSN